MEIVREYRNYVYTVFQENGPQRDYEFGCSGIGIMLKQKSIQNMM